jgi:hypothetical protein
MRNRSWPSAHRWATFESVASRSCSQAQPPQARYIEKSRFRHRSIPAEGDASALVTQCIFRHWTQSRFRHWTNKFQHVERTCVRSDNGMMLIDPFNLDRDEITASRDPLTAALASFMLQNLFQRFDGAVPSFVPNQVNRYRAGVPLKSPHALTPGTKSISPRAIASSRARRTECRRSPYATKSS